MRSVSNRINVYRINHIGGRLTEFFMAIPIFIREFETADSFTYAKGIVSIDQIGKNGNKPDFAISKYIKRNAKECYYPLRLRN